MRMHVVIMMTMVAGMLHGHMVEARPAVDKAYSVALGLGLPYGGGGVNLEAQITPLVAITGGVGMMGEDVGYNAGFRLYHRPARWPSVHLRGTLLYGTNAMYDKDYRDDKNLESGLTLGLGARWFFSDKWALDVDLTYAFIDEPEGYELSGSAISMATGVAYRF